MNEWFTVGEMRLHIPSVVVVGLRLVAVTFGSSQPYRDELMQAWFNGCGALLTTEGGLSEQEAAEYLSALIVTLLPHMSANARQGIVKSLCERVGLGDGSDTRLRNTACPPRVDIALHLLGPAWFELQDYDLNGSGLRALAADLSERLCSAAAVLDKLQADGWLIKVVNSNLEAQHPKVRNHDQAVSRMRRLTIDEDAILDIAEWSRLGERLSPS